MNKLKDLLNKLLAKGFATAEEKAEVKTLMTALKSEEQEEVKADAEEVSDLPETEAEAKDEGIAEEEIKSLVAGEIAKQVATAVDNTVEKMSNEIVNKFMAGVKKNRRVATQAKEETKEKFAESRDFFKKLFTGQTESLKAAGYLDTGTNGTAGYLVPPAEFIAEVYRIAETGYGVARSNMRYIPKNGPGNEMTLPAMSASVSAFWTDEAGAKKSTEPSFTLPTITLKKLAAIVPWTDEFGDDVGVPVIQLLAELFAEQLAKMEDIAFFKGDGTATYGGFTGILNNGSVNTVTMVGDSILEVTADELLDMQDATPAGAQDGAVYFMHRSVLNVVRKLKDDNNNYIYQAPGGSQPATLWNKPVVVVEALPSTNDDADDAPFVIYGNLRNTCVISDKGTLAMDIFNSGVVRNVTDNGDLNLITQDMKAMRVVRRVGFAVILPTGLCVLKTAVAGS